MDFGFIEILSVRCDMNDCVVALFHMELTGNIFVSIFTEVKQINYTLCISRYFVALFHFFILKAYNYSDISN